MKRVKYLFICFVVLFVVQCAYSQNIIVQQHNKPVIRKPARQRKHKERDKDRDEDKDRGKDKDKDDNKKKFDDDDDRDDDDRPDLAMEQEARLTRDPATGRVERERLQNVLNIIKQQRANQKAQLQSGAPSPSGASPSASLANANWVERGPTNVGGRTRAIMFDPNDNTHKKVWAGGVDGGLWVCNDITAATPTWTTINDFWANLAVSTIACSSNPTRSDVFYVGTGEGWFNIDAAQGAGIWKTTDGGVTWNQLSSTSTDVNFNYVEKIVVDTAGNVFAATSSQYCNRGGIFKSTDGGNTWTLVLGTQGTTCANSNCSGADLEIGADATIYASLGIFNVGGIYRSTNDGTTWTQINTKTNGFPNTNINRIEIGVAPSDANRLYAMVQNATSDALLNIYTSDNKGTTWTTCQLPKWHDQSCSATSNDMTRTQAWYDLIIAVDPNNAANVLVGGVDIMKSTNNGTSWTQISSWWGGCGLPYMHADQHAIAFQPGSSSNAVFGNDGGVFYSTNITATSPGFASEDNSYNVTQFYACAMDPTAGKNYFMAGAQDNGTQLFTTAGLNATTDVVGGDGAYCFIDQTSPTYQIGSYTYNNYYLSTNNWVSSTQISNAATGDFINPADYDNNNHILYSASSTTQIQRITGINTTPGAPALFTVTGMAALPGNIRVSPYSPAGTTTLFVGTQDGHLFKVTNAQGGAPVTTNISGTAAPWATAASISCIEIGASENDLVVTFSNYGVVSVWRTTNGGTTWNNAEGNLPDMPIWWVMYNPNDLSQALLGTEIGVWSTDDITVASPNWVVNNNNLANCRVCQLRMRSSDEEVIAATHGRGLFSTNVFALGPPTANFTASPTEVCKGGSVTFTDESSENPTSWKWTFTGGTPSSSTTQNNTVTYSTPGIYPVTLIATNGSGSDTLTETNYITVDAPLVVSVNSLSICNGTSGTLNASGATTYSWQPSAGLSATTGASVSANPTITTTYTVTVSNACGTSSATSVVTVNSLASVSVNSPTICNGSSGTLNASGAATYSWFPATGLSATTGASVTANPTINTTYTVTGTSTCGTTSATSVVTVSPLPTVSVSGINSICIGGSTGLLASGANTYSWLPNTGLNVTSGASITANPTTTTTYTITGISASGCRGTRQITITVNPIPTVSISGNNSICPGGNTSLLASGANTYTWLPAAGLNVTSGASVTASPTVSTTYTVTGTSSSGCTGTQQIAIIVEPLPVVSISGEDTICAGGNTTLTASGANIYTWQPSTGLNVTTGASVTANPIATTTYTVTGTNSCGGTASATVVVRIQTVSINISGSTSICSPDTGENCAPVVSDDFSNPGLWTHSGPDAYTVSVNSGVTQYDNTTDGVEDRIYRKLPTTLSNNYWKAEFMFTINSSNPPGSGTGALLLGATAGNLDFWADANNGFALTNQDCIDVNLVTVSVSDNNINHWYFHLQSKKGTTFTGSDSILANSSISTYYIRLERLSKNLAQLSIFTDPGFSVPVAGSPVTCNVDPTISGLSYVQQGNLSAGYSDRMLANAQTDNLTICSDTSGNVLTASGANTYTWLPTSGLNVSTGASVSANPTITTTYTVTGTTANGCTGNQEVVITVNPPPTILISGTNIICIGGNTNLSASGANTYMWSPNPGLNFTTGASVTANPTITTTYTVTGTSASGCTGSQQITITVNPLPTVSISGNNSICSGGNTALLASGANTYKWLPATGLNVTSGASVTASPTITTTYTVAGTSAGGCTGTQQITITVNPLPSVSISGNNSICSGGNTALLASGANTYAWLPATGLNETSGANVTASPTITTTYTVTGTSVSGCTGSQQITITVNPLPTVSISGNNSICTGGNTALLASGANTYSWLPATGLNVTSGASVTASPTITTTYTVTGTSASGCTGSQQITITVNPLPTVSISGNNSICSGGNTALLASGANTYKWLPATGLNVTSGASVTASPTITTTYTVAGTSAGGCTGTQQITITVNPLPSVSISGNNSICSGGNTALLASGANTYSWLPATGLNVTSGASVTASPTITTTYTVTGTSVSGCTGAQQITITVNPLPTVSISGNNSICTGGNTSLLASGANAYKWLPATGLNVTSGASVTASPTITTTYTVAGTSAGGCTGTQQITITVNPLPTVSISGNNSICTGGNTALLASGANTYTWLPATGLNVTSGASVAASPTITTTYTVTGTSAGGCTGSQQITIIVNPLPTVSISGTNNICIGGNTSLLASGANTYSWSPNINLSATTGASVTANPTITTTYTVTGTSASGCTGTQQITFTVNPLPSVSISGNNSICSGGNTALLASGANTYKWLPAVGLNITSGAGVTASPTITTTYTVTGTSASGCTGTQQITITVNPLPTVSISGNNSICGGGNTALLASGANTYTWLPATGLNITSGASVTASPTVTTTYTVTGTSAGGCTGAQQITITVNPLPTVSISGNNSICAGSNTALLASGANTYTWLPAAELNVTSGASVTASPTITTTYTVTGTSAGGCTGTQQITITVNPLPTVSIIGNNSICGGGNTALLASGANTYTWLPAAGLNITSGASITASPTITTTYTVTGTSASGCTGTQQITITVNPLPTVSISGNNSICSGGNTALLASGANTYAWLPASGLNVTTGESVTASPTITTTYTVTGTSASGCTGTQQITITVNPLPTVSISGNNSICNGGNTALLASGANTYSWLPTTGLNVTSGASVTASPSITTTYAVTGTSASGCTGTQQITITVNPLPAVSIIGNNSICAGGNTALLASGANTYKWLPATGLNVTSGASVTASPSITTTYTVTGTNASGCAGTQQITITVNPLPTVSISGNNSICTGGNTALLASGANTYKWLPATGLNITSGASVTATPTITTTYTVTGTSAGGCTGTQQITITVNPLPAISISGNNSICSGGNTALLASGANTYSWLPTTGLNVTSGASVTASPSITTTYAVTGTSASGCTGTQQITITVNPLPTVFISGNNSICTGGNTALLASGANTYKWLPATGLNVTLGASVTANPTITTTYTVTGTSAGGCTGTQQITITVNPLPTVSISGNNSICTGGNTALLASGANTYKWLPATGLNVTLGASVTANPTITTTYTVTGISAGGCTGTQQITITVNPLPAVSIGGNNSICNGANTALLASGANTYTWLPASGLNVTSGASATASPTITTTYTVTGISASGCTGSQQITITVNPLPTVSINGNSSICSGGNTALLASGANTYAWSPAAGLNITSGASVSANPTITTTYTVTGTSASGCTDIQQITITVNPLPTVSISGNNSICIGGNTALLASGANTYTWLPASGLNVTSGASVTASPTITTTYTVTGTSAGGCTGTQQITITVNPLPAVSIGGNNSICSGGNTVLLASGANTYTWLPASGLNVTSGASVTASPTITTTYTVIGTSAGGCTGTQQITITVNPLPTVSISGNNSICSGGNTSLLANGANTYTWLPTTGLNVTSGASVTTSPTITTTYTVTGTSASGCTGTQQITITVNPLPAISISGNNSICSGGNTALLASGANTYSWLPTTGLNVTSGASVTASPSITTTYAVTGTSASGCTGTQQITITVNLLPTISISGNNSICSGGNTTLLANGANTYAWLPVTGLNVTSGASVTANPTITTTYTVTGTSAGGCTGSQQITITVNPLPTVSISGNNNICSGSNTALLVSGANTYMWLPATGLNVTSGASVTASPTITTTYTVTGTSAGGCTGSQQITITVNPLPTVSISGNNSICAGGNTALLASGASTYKWLPAVGLNITSGASVTASPTTTTTYTATGTSASGCTGLQQITITVNPLPTVSISGNNNICSGSNTALLASGANTYTWLPATGLNVTSGASVTASPTITTTYTVTGTGAGDCTGTQQITITVNPLPTVSISGNNSICAGGNTTLLASGANTYTWLPTTGLNVTSGASVTASPTITTTYTVTGTSASGCTGRQQITITVNPLPTVSISGNNSICNGNNTSLLASGSATYSWSPNVGLNVTTGSAVTANPTITTTYTIAGTNSCSTTSTTFVVNVNSLPSVSVNSLTICNGTSGTLNANGATTYSWSPATGLSATTGANITANPTVRTTYTVTGTSTCGTTSATSVVTVTPLPSVSVNSLTICNGSSGTLNASGATTYSWLPAAGLSTATSASVTANPTINTTYTVTGTSTCGTTSATSTVTVSPLPAVSVSGNNSICNGDNTTLLASGANTYTWLPASGLNVTSGASVTANPTITTTYTVTGTSAAGCTGIQQITITVNPLPTVSISGNNSICSGGNTALLASGANTYKWLPATGLNITSGASVTASPTITTTYTVTGTSAGGCTGTQQITINVNPLPTVSISGNNSICSGGNTALLASGANTYTWLPASGLNITSGASVTASPTITTTYTVTGTNAGGCTGTQQITVTVNPLPTVSISGNNNICSGGNTALLASGANTYTWLPTTGLNVTSGASVTASPTITTTYTVTGTSASGCTGRQQITITVNPLPTVSISGNNSICNGKNTALLASGANTYKWLPATSLNITSGASVTATPTITTTYTVTGTSAGGCTGTQQITITVNPLPAVSISGNNSICTGGNTALLASGANAYTWLPATGLNVTSGASVTASPTITTTYTVTGTSAGGCTGTQQITINVNPLPTVSISGNNSICSGGNTALLASGANTYTWLPATGLNVTSGASVTASPTITTTYTVTGTNSCGTTTSTFVLTVNSLPTVSVNSLTICSGTSGTLNAGGATTYSWSPATGLSATTGASVTANPTINTTYTVTGTSTCGTTSAISVVTVSPLPSVSVNALTICNGSSGILNASGTTTYSWSPAAGLSATTGASVTASPSINTTYTVTGTSTCGTTLATSTVTVSPLPAVSVSGNNSICNGDNTTLLASGANTYTWLPATGLNVTSGASVTASPTITTTYTVTGTSASGCTGTQQITITVNPLPTVSISGNNSICNGGNTALLASGANTYAWLPATSLNVTSGAGVTASPIITTTYIVTGTSAGGCTGSQQITVTVTPLPAISISGTNTICSGSSTSLTASGASAYTWSPNIGLNVTTGASVTASPTIATTYTVTGTNGNNCSASQQVAITVNSSPIVSIIWTADVCPGKSTTLTGIGASSYTWSPAIGLDATTGAIVSASPINPITYTVTGTDVNGCTGTQQAGITINPLPSVSISGSNTICNGNNTTLTASGADTYTWLPATGLNVTTGAIVSAGPTVTTTYTVTGTNSCGTTSATYPVIVNTAPTVSVNALTICNGSNGTLTASGATTYTWLPSTAISSTTGTSVIVNPTVTTTYTVTGTGTCGTNSATAIVTVGSLPFISVNTLALCNGTSGILNASGASNYSWQPATGLGATTGANVTASPTTTTTYTITGTSTCGTTSATTIVTVNFIPTVSISGTNTICRGNNTSLMASGASTYKWLPAIGLNVTSGANVLANPTITSTYTVTGTNINGCTDAQQITLTVVPLPVVSISGANSICDGDSASLTAAGAFTYIWSTGETTAGIKVSPTVNATYTLTGTDAHGCMNSDTATLTLKAAVLLAVNPQSTVCTGQTSVVLSASGAATYTWSPADNLTPSAGTSASETAQISQLTFYTVTGMDANSCTASVVVPVATIVTGGLISPAFSIICNGGTKALSVTGAAGNDYQWQISADNVNWSNITGATNTTYTTASSDGNTNKFYRLMAQSNSCWNVASTTSEVDISSPIITLTTTSITDNSLTLNWSPTGTGNYNISYSGTSSGTQTSVTPAKTITGLTANGTYSITVTQTGVAGCPASGTITGVTTLCAMPTGVTLSSPASGQILVSWTGVPGADYRVYYRPLFSYNTYFTQDVSNASSILLTKQGVNNLYASTTYEVYVSRLDCPNTGNVGQGTNPTNVTTLPTVTCATPQIDSVRSVCPVQIEVFIHDNGVNQYTVFIQRITPSILAVNSYGLSGTYFSINVPYSGDQYLIALEAKCGSAISGMYVYPGNVTVKPLCPSPNNLVLSNPTCHGFTASWNADECLSNPASQYLIYERVAGTINYNDYGVPLPANGIGPNKLINFLATGETYQVFVRSVYSCNGFVTYGPSSQVQTITTLSNDCRDEDVEQPQENKPATQQYSPDNSEVFSLYPNPNTGKFIIDLSRLNTEEDAVRIEVINMLGQTVLTHITTISAGHMSEYINLPNGTATGTYIVRLTAGRNVYTAKINVSK